MSDTIRSDIHASEVSPSISTETRVPEPAGIVEPVKLNPNTVEPPVDIVKPAAAAAPPPAPVTVTPSTMNWKPAIAVSLSKLISTVPPGWSGQSSALHSVEPSQHTVP